MPLTFFIAVIIVILGSIQLLSTFHTYALNLAELNSLRNQEAALVAKKAELENDIKRWDDDAYVTAQARERLGFVFPGERSVRVLHPEAVTGGAATGNDKTSTATTEQTKPWYKDLFSSLSKADEGTSKNDSKNASGSQSAESNGTAGGTGSASTGSATSGSNTGGSTGTESNNTKEGQ
nr:septum formation initiator family protein [Bifidobacterium callimiconis]